MSTTPRKISGRAGFAVDKDEQWYICVYLNFSFSVVVYGAVNNARKVVREWKMRVKMSNQAEASILFSVEYTETSYAVLLRRGRYGRPGF